MNSSSFGNDSDHVCLYPYSASGLIKGWSKVTGMEALLAREIGLREGRSDVGSVTIVCDGAESDHAFEITESKVSVQPVPHEADASRTQALRAVWFDELWSLMHPQAFTFPALTDELAQVVYPEDSDHPPGSFERLAEHVARRSQSRSADVENWFADRFESALNGIPPGTTIGWTEVFFQESIRRHAGRLRRAGSKQSLHCFLAHPESLHLTPHGQSLLRAMSEMDVVFMQTDIYIRRLEAQLEAMGLRIPDLRRFDLAPDSVALRRAVRQAPPCDSDFGNLDTMQRELLQEAMATRDSVPHRFVCPDRLDPIKGIHVVIEAVDKFLASQNESLETLRSKFRFFFVTDYLTRFPPVDHSLAWHRYADWVRTHQIPRFRERWPGVVTFADNIPDRFLWAHLLVDAHVISGGIQEGLGLAVQEGLIVNAETGHGRTVIMGDGAGFSIQVQEQGLGEGSWFPAAGDATQFAEHLRQVTNLSPADHLNQSARLVKDFIDPHQDRLLETSF